MWKSRKVRWECLNDAHVKEAVQPGHDMFLVIFKENEEKERMEETITITHENNFT